MPSAVAKPTVSFCGPSATQPARVAQQAAAIAACAPAWARTARHDGCRNARSNSTARNGPPTKSSLLAAASAIDNAATACQRPGRAAAAPRASASSDSSRQALPSAVERWVAYATVSVASGCATNTHASVSATRAAALDGSRPARLPLVSAARVMASTSMPLTRCSSRLPSSAGSGPGPIHDAPMASDQVVNGRLARG